MQPTDFDKWNSLFAAKAENLYPSSDPSHDVLHIRRVVAMALKLARLEKADIHVVLPAAYFHDFVNIPKNDPRRKEASRLSADAAADYLGGTGYPARYLEAIRHAIAAHSFSANITPETIEAKVVQDADRLDGLGAIGVARCFSTSALMQRPYYCPDDPWAETRELDDGAFAIDHFPVKLFRIAASMQTETARQEAQKRLEAMKTYLEQLRKEIESQAAILKLG